MEEKQALYQRNQELVEKVKHRVHKIKDMMIAFTTAAYMLSQELAEEQASSFKVVR